MADRLFYKCSIAILLIGWVGTASTVFAQTGADIQGRVLNTGEESISGINVSLQGTHYGAATNKKGYYEIMGIPAGKYALAVSGIGYQTQKKEITLKDGQALTINVTLSTSSEELREIVVQGNNAGPYAVQQSEYVAKIPLKKLENPQVYTSIPKELLTDQMVFSIEGALKNAPGLQKMWEATGRSGDGGAYFNSRGFILQSKLRNGVAGNITSRVDAVNLERVEVVKGPSATLFGSTLTSYGGLINRVTKKPYKSFGGEVAYTAGSYDLNRISADINVPLDSAKKVLLRVNTAYHYEGSFQDNAFSKYFLFDPSLSYRVNDRLTLSFDAELYSGRNLGTTIFFFPYGQTAASLGTNRADELPIDYRRSFSTSDLSQQSRNSSYFGKLHYDISESWSTETNFSATHSFSDGPYPYFYLLSDAGVTGVPNDTGNNYISRNDQFTSNSNDGMIEIQQNIKGEFDLGPFQNRFVGGLDFFHHDDNEFFSGASFDTVASHGHIPDYRDFNKTNLEALYMNHGVDFIYPVNVVSNTYSTYASEVLNVTGNLKAMAALRVDHFVNKGTYDVTTGSTSGGYHQTAFSPKFGLVYELLDDQVSLFGNYQNGFTNQTGTNYSGAAFRPEHANQWEGGIKLDILAGKFSSTFSYYDIEVKDIVRPDPAHPNFSMQDGTQSSKGFEAEVIASPVQGMNLIAGFSYNNSKFEKADPDVEGHRPATAMSPYAANFWVSYRLPEIFLDGVGLGFGGNYVSDNKVVNSESQGVFIIPAYTVLNASVFYDCSKFRFSLKAGNLINREYWTGYTTLNPQKLRSFAGSIAFKF